MSSAFSLEELSVYYCLSSLLIVYRSDFALKYALVIVAGLQLAAYPLAKNITNQTDTIEHENDK